MIVYEGVDEVGDISTVEAIIEPGEALGTVSILAPLWLTDPLVGSNMYLDCAVAGGCLFDTEDVFGLTAPSGYPVYASWALEATCVEYEFHEPSPTTTQCDGNANCPEGQICINGACVDEEVVLGTGSGEECEPDPDTCPEGEVCLFGICVEEVVACGNGHGRGKISSRLNCGWDNNPCSFTMDATGDAYLHLQYKTYATADRFEVTISTPFGTTDHTVECSNPTGQDWQTAIFPVPGGSATIEVEVFTCDESENGQYNWHAYCDKDASVQENDGEQGFWIGGNSLVSDNENGIPSVALYPNPFSATLSVELNLTENFSGDILILDYQGVEKLRQPVQFEQGYSNFEIVGLSTLNEGMYVVAIVKDGVIRAAKTVVKM